MAVLHHATLTPTKIEMLAAWVGGQPWGQGVDPADVEIVGAYRFDDPDGEVGIETFLLSGADGVLLHVPLTYRAAPLADAYGALLAVAEHSVLGSRWVYDAAVDEVYARSLLATMVESGHQAAIEFATPDGLVPWELTTFVQGHPGSTAAAVGDPAEVDGHAAAERSDEPRAAPTAPAGSRHRTDRGGDAAGHLARPGLRSAPGVGGDRAVIADVLQRLAQQTAAQEHPVPRDPPGRGGTVRW